MNSANSSFPPFDSAPFLTTQWTKVLAARGTTVEAREALRELCEAYYEPVVAFLVRCQRDAAARETAHEFFEAVLGGNTFATIEREGGRFRSYLLGALKHFMSHRRSYARRLKRGGGHELVSLDVDTDMSPGLSLVDEAVLAPDQAFDRAWAMTMLQRALARVRRACEQEKRGDQFERLKPWLTGEEVHGDQMLLARELGMEVGALKSAVHRLKRRFRQAVKQEIGETLTRPEDVEAEMQALFSALR